MELANLQLSSRPDHILDTLRMAVQEIDKAEYHMNSEQRIQNILGLLDDVVRQVQGLTTEIRSLQ